MAVATRSMPAPATERGTGARGKRRRQILDVAAARFRSHGYGAASMRDIAGEVGILAGSLYHHFPSKDDLFTAVHEEGIRRITAAVTGALAGVHDPWARLEAAMVAHLTYLLEGGDYAVVVLRALPVDLRAHRRLVALRDDYEGLYRGLVDALPLPAGVTAQVGRDSLRLMLLGALNVYVRDVQFIVDVGLLLLFWLTPILYGWWTVQQTLADRGLPDWAFDVYMANPLAAATVAFQQGAWPGTPPQEYFDSVFALRLWGTVAVCALLVWLAQRIFNRLQENFAAEL